MEIERLSTAEWAEAWRRLPAAGRELYFRPEYSEICARWEGARAECVRVAGRDGFLLYPYLVHPNDGACDVQTAYGYGGPVFVGSWGAEERAAALGRVGEWFRSTGAVAEFVRCHPEWVDHEGLVAAGYRVFQVRTNVECELAGEDVSAGWASAARRNLRKAEASGLTFREGEGDADWAAFESLYARTAERLAMTALYRFDHAYFAGLRGVEGVRLVVVEKGTHPVAGAVVFVGGELAHYHLGGSDFAFQQDRPNDLLYLAMATVARRAGCRRIVWGGGMSNDPADSLFRFKAHFGAVRRAVYCAGRVIDPTGFEKLVAGWRERNPGKEPKLFLKYRA